MIVSKVRTMQHVGWDGMGWILQRGEVITGRVCDNRDTLSSFTYNLCSHLETENKIQGTETREKLVKEKVKTV